MINYILKNKKPIEEPDVLKWAKWRQSNFCQVALTEIGKVRISTVFLGIDHRFIGGGAPILFETMIFGGKLDQEQERYCTWDEAEKGHKLMVERIKELIK